MFGSALKLVNQTLPSRLTIVQSFTSLLAPPVCVLCGGPGQRLDEPWGLDLCVHCEHACPKHLDQSEAERLRSTGRAAPGTLVTLFDYDWPVNSLITRLKFGHELAPARVLGMLFARHCRARELPLPDCIVPMPLHPRRRRERGFNQCEEIARHLAPRLRVPVEPQLLHRCRETAAQSTLSAQARAYNVAGAFVTAPRRVPGHIALLDDVMTTGSTFAAAAGALMRGGAVRVDAWIIARALRDDPA
jgi:ComF family protein